MMILYLVLHPRKRMANGLLLYALWYVVSSIVDFPNGRWSKRLLFLDILFDVSSIKKEAAVCAKRKT
jgi:hypothetical protein